MLVLCGQDVQKNPRKKQPGVWMRQWFVPPGFAPETVSIHPVAGGYCGVCGTCQEQQAEVFSGWLERPWLFTWLSSIV